jgi:hypothetical protein
MQVYQFFTPVTAQKERDPLSITASLLQLQEGIKADLSTQIKAGIDSYFMKLAFPAISTKTKKKSL